MYLKDTSQRLRSSCVFRKGIYQQRQPLTLPEQLQLAPQRRIAHLISISFSPSESDGIPTGVKAGVGVGISLGFLALAAVGYLLYRRYRRKAAATDGCVQDWNTPELSDQTKEAKELNDDSAVARELPGSPPAELEGHGHIRIDET